MNIKSIAPVPEGIEKALETQNRLTETLQPMLEQQKRIEEITAGIKMDSPHMRIGSPLLEAFETAQNSELQFATKQISEVQTNSGIQMALEAFNKFNYSFIEKSLNAANRLNEVFQRTVSPAIQWLQSIDYNPIITFLQGLDFDVDVSKRYKELNKAYLQAMFDCNWFPYAGWSVDIRMFNEVNDILSSSRGISKRCISRIDKAVFSYYTDYKIKDIKRSWKNSELEPHIKKMLGQAINAHLRGEYALTITCLATMWEGWLRAKMPTKKRTSEEYKNDVKELVVENGFEEVLGDFYNKLIIKKCYSAEETDIDIPNRHSIAHSWYKGYPSKKSSLNSILLTEFIINLNPLEET